MKLHFLIILTAAGPLAGNSAPFQNLDFDEANTNRFVIGTYGEVSDMLPGWQLSNGIPGLNLVGYNAFAIGLNYATIYDTNFPNISDIARIVEGKYALGLYPGTDDNGNFAAYHLSQTGDIPTDAKTILFTSFGGPFELRVNGDLLPLVYEYPPDYVPSRFGSVIASPAVGDISAFAGQTVGLEFITLGFRNPFDYNLKGIDSISFSPEMIPEPSSWALLGLGGSCLLFRWRFLRVRGKTAT
jgi:hypothetical protein